MDKHDYRTRGVIQDKTLAHQIQLVFASRVTMCLNGESVSKTGVAVTCNCHRIGNGDNFRIYLGPAPDLTAAWAAYNDHLEKENH